MSASHNLRLAEVVAALSLATDLGMGQPMGHALRTCLLSTRMAQILGLNDMELCEVYYVALLRRIGCTGDSHDVARWFPDDLSAHARVFVIDFGNPLAVVRDVARHAGEGQSPGRRARSAIRALAGGKSGAAQFFRASCEVAQNLGERLNIPASVLPALEQTFERWDGRGFPQGVKGERLALSARIAQLAEDAEAHHRLGGAEAALERARFQAGRVYDPALVAAFLEHAGELLKEMEVVSPWESVMALEPPPAKTLTEKETDAALEVMADFADLKSPFFSGHSRGVALLASRAATAMGLPAATMHNLWQAGLVHDLGRVGIPNKVWEKPGPLNDGEWEMARLHPYYTQRALARPAALAEAATLASMHHERLDGSGYHRAIGAASLSLPARILAAADLYQTKTERRPHREALSAQQAADATLAAARSGALDLDTVNATLAAPGQRARRRNWPAGLTDREVEVLRLVAQGQTLRQAAEALRLSAFTVNHHVRHIYDKIGVSTRAAATLFAMQHDLLKPDDEAKR